jgi:prephenate dehydrogenase
MTIQITLIGLGQIGASMGLALASQKNDIRRVGHDKEPAVAKRAKEIGAVDQTEINLHTSVEKADVVVLAIPIDQVRETLEWIAPDLRENCVVLDTAPVREAVAKWTSELLPANRHYVGLTPIINPAYLNANGSGIALAHADLFQNGMMGILSAANANSEAVKLATDLTRLLGAVPFYADIAEMDGLLASTYLLPQIVAAALLETTLDKPGWREARKVAGRSYSKATSPAVEGDLPAAFARAAVLNRENTVRTIDNLVAALQDMREEIQQEDEAALAARATRLQAGRERWWQQRSAGDWKKEDMESVEMPKASDMFGNLFGLRRKPKENKK